jgi:hypothetical protein
VKRELRPRAPVVVRPTHVSQLTCEAVLGIDPRRYLEVLVPHCAHVATVGKLRIISLEDAEEALRALSKSSAEPAATDNAVEDEGPATADEFLSRLGRRRTA